MKFVNLFLIIIFVNSPQAFAKTKSAAPIDSFYYLEIITSQKDCKKATGKSCFYRDHAIDKKPYFHKTKIIIFQSKAIAIQQSNHKDKIIKIKDLHYIFTTTNKNLISFNTKNGKIDNLILLKGNLKKEKIEESECVKTKISYDYYRTYGRKNELAATLGSYEDEYNFNSMSQYFIFAPTDDLTNIMAVKSTGNEDFMPIKDLKLCKFSDSKKAIVKHVNHRDCLNKAEPECFKYEKCKDYLETQNCKVTLFEGLDI